VSNWAGKVNLGKGNYKEGFGLNGRKDVLNGAGSSQQRIESEQRNKSAVPLKAARDGQQVKKPRVLHWRKVKLVEKANPHRIDKDDC